MNSGSRKLLWGTGLLALAYIWLAVPPVLSLIYQNDDSVKHKLAPDVSLVSIALILVEIVIALGPLRKGERWAIWAAALPFVVVGIPRLLTDSGCQLSDLHHHGCHQFMGAMALGVIGLVISALDIFGRGKAAGASV